MPMPAHDRYDAVVIGAGIGGLVCGCFLAQAGLRVLIAEQHDKPGGYCTSFRRKGFTFDAAAHSFGGYANGPLGSIFKKLRLDEKIAIQRFDPSDTIITPHYRISFWADVEKTIQEFQSSFPKEKHNIEKFFHFLVRPDPNSFSRMRRLTFKDVLDQYFDDEKLKALLSFPLFGNSGLPPSQLSAFIGSKIFKEFLLDGGYYPAGGMQALSDALADRFRDFGGETRFRSRVKKIIVKNGAVEGVLIDNGALILAKCVIANCDARQTFLELLGEGEIGNALSERVEGMSPTMSMFAVYLGMDKSLVGRRENIWFFSHYDLDHAYESAKRGDFDDLGRYLLHIAPEQRVVQAYLNAPFMDRSYWDSRKNLLLERFIASIEQTALPKFTQHIVYKEAATPYTMYKYTLNHAGAAYGWESRPLQLADPDFKKPSVIQGLYLSGHWTTQGLGIPGVTYVGYDTANIIINRLLKKSLVSDKIVMPVKTGVQ